MEIRNLIEMRPGDEGIVVDIKGGYGFLRRLEYLGVRVGVKIKKVSSQFLRGPVIIQVGNTQVALGYGMASKILLKEENLSEAGQNSK